MWIPLLLIGVAFGICVIGLRRSSRNESGPDTGMQSAGIQGSEWGSCTAHKHSGHHHHDGDCCHDSDCGGDGGSSTD